jgi:hypothetical protein
MPTKSFVSLLFSDQRTWELSHGEMALSELSHYDEHPVRDPQNPDEPAID